MGEGRDLRERVGVGANRAHRSGEWQGDGLDRLCRIADEHREDRSRKCDERDRLRCGARSSVRHGKAMAEGIRDSSGEAMSAALTVRYADLVRMRTLLLIAAALGCACGPATQAGGIPEYTYEIVHTYRHDPMAFT